MFFMTIEDFDDIFDYSSIPRTDVSDWPRRTYAASGDNFPVKRASPFTGDSREFNVHSIEISNPVAQNMMVTSHRHNKGHFDGSCGGSDKAEKLSEVFIESSLDPGELSEFNDIESIIFELPALDF